MSNIAKNMEEMRVVPDPLEQLNFRAVEGQDGLPRGTVVLLVGCVALTAATLAGVAMDRVARAAKEAFFGGGDK
jgi:hypothetical protein